MALKVESQKVHKIQYTLLLLVLYWCLDTTLRSIHVQTTLLLMLEVLLHTYPESDYFQLIRIVVKT